MDDGAIVLGNVELTANAVTLSVNSEARAARGRALLESVLAGLVRTPLVERQTVEQMMALSRDRSSAQDALPLPPDEERRIIHQSLTDHYRQTLDEPIPSLGNQSPRKAAKKGKGREKVIAWLKMLENHSATTSPGSGSNLTSATSVDEPKVNGPQGRTSTTKICGELVRLTAQLHGWVWRGPQRADRHADFTPPLRNGASAKPGARLRKHDRPM